MAAVVCMSAAVSAKPPRRAEAQRHYDAAVAHYKAQEYAQAAEEFEAAYALKADSEWLYNIAQSYRLAKQPDKALDYYHRYLTAVPDAENRAAVEQRIAEIEKTQAATERTTAPPASGTPMQTFPPPSPP